jgi:hypothetical protein
MATRKNNIFGKLSGRLGKTTTRIRYGKEVVYSLPEKVNISNSKASKTVRKKFALTVKLAKFINSIPPLSASWSAAKIPGTNPYQKLIKHNAKLTGENNLTLNNIITPLGVLPAPLSCTYKDDAINIEINKSLSASLPFIIHTVFYFYEPSENKLDDFSFEYTQKEITDSATNRIASVSLKLSGTQKTLYDSYNHCILYIALTSSKGKAKWSSTSSFIIP